MYKVRQLRLIASCHAPDLFVRPPTCVVAQTGLCIDVRRKVWSSPFNDSEHYVDIGHKMKAERKAFARVATRLLRKYNNKLPTRYRCSDTRHTFMHKEKGDGHDWEKRVHDPLHLDATLFKFALANF